MECDWISKHRKQKKKHKSQSIIEMANNKQNIYNFFTKWPAQCMAIEIEISTGGDRPTMMPRGCQVVP